MFARGLVEWALSVRETQFFFGECDVCVSKNPVRNPEIFQMEAVEMVVSKKGISLSKRFFFRFHVCFLNLQEETKKEDVKKGGGIMGYLLYDIYIHYVCHTALQIPLSIFNLVARFKPCAMLQGQTFWRFVAWLVGSGRFAPRD